MYDTPPQIIIVGFLIPTYRNGAEAEDFRREWHFTSNNFLAAIVDIMSQNVDDVNSGGH